MSQQNCPECGGKGGNECSTRYGNNLKKLTCDNCNATG